MKRQIRRGVFETNSSSTHSLQISKQSTQQAYRNCIERILGRYKGEYDDEADISNFIENNTFYLKGLFFEDGDEHGNVYYIITSWWAKLQLIAMLIQSDETEILGNYKEDRQYTLPVMWDNINVCKLFKEFVISECHKRGYENIDNVVSKLVYKTYYGFDSTYLYIEQYMEDNGTVSNIFHNNKYDYDNNKTDEEYLANFTKFMDDDVTLTYMDEAYQPYNKPVIKII